MYKAGIDAQLLPHISGGALTFKISSRGCAAPKRLLCRVLPLSSGLLRGCSCSLGRCPPAAACFGVLPASLPAGSGADLGCSCSLGLLPLVSESAHPA